jgi:hypothetical protein
MWKIHSQVAELKLQSTEKVGIAELQLRNNIFLNCGIAVAKVLPSICGCDCGQQKKVARAYLCFLLRVFLVINMNKFSFLWNVKKNLKDGQKYGL